MIKTYNYTSKKIKIDLKDRKILSESDWDARLSNAEICRRIVLSKKGIEYRIKRLERFGVIKGYYPVINFRKLGYISKRISIRLKHSTENIRNEIEKYLVSNDNFGWIIWVNGEYDLAISTRIKNSVEFYKEIEKFFLKFGKYIESKEFGESIGMREFKLKYLLNKPSKESYYIEPSDDTVEISNLEEKLIGVLLKNARISLVDISNRLKSSPKTIKSKMKKLKGQGILLGT